jgi:hypothetical protein
LIFLLLVGTYFGIKIVSGQGFSSSWEFGRTAEDSLEETTALIE